MEEETRETGRRPKLDRASTAESRSRSARQYFPIPSSLNQRRVSYLRRPLFLRASIQPRLSVVMDGDRSSHPPQVVEIPPSKHAYNGDSEPPAVNGTTIGHVDTNVKKTMEELVPDTVEIEPSVQEGEEGEEEGSVPSSPESDDGLHDVPLNGGNPNVGFSSFPFVILTL